MEIPLASWRPNADLESALRQSRVPKQEHHYHLEDEQQRLAAQLNLNYDLIVALALRGHACNAICAGFGVSRETIARRLRPLGFLNPPGVRGASLKKRRLGAHLKSLL
jgi:hypothetical protein